MNTDSEGSRELVINSVESATEVASVDDGEISEENDSTVLCMLDETSATEDVELARAGIFAANRYILIYSGFCCTLYRPFYLFSYSSKDKRIYSVNNSYKHKAK